ncbi:MAG: gamma-glutamylcyclotransferase [Proteobacteria bacterium]|nr:gamma-glutamylcyclotransferase [Pseudomonadota bacterium]
MPAYFAYGANMCPDVLLRRAIAWEHAYPARLAGFRLEFTTPGLRWIEPAFASVAVDAECVVHGVLYEMSQEALDRLGEFEGEDYRELDVTVSGPDGHRPARTYQCLRPIQGRRPSRRYLGVMRSGALTHGLPDELLASLDAVDCAYIPVVSELFTAAFGTFDYAHRLLTPSAVRS